MTQEKIILHVVIINQSFFQKLRTSARSAWTVKWTLGLIPVVTYLPVDLVQACYECVPFVENLFRSDANKSQERKNTTVITVMFILLCLFLYTNLFVYIVYLISVWFLSFWSSQLLASYFSSCFNLIWKYNYCPNFIIDVLDQ